MMHKYNDMYICRKHMYMHAHVVNAVSIVVQSHACSTRARSSSVVLARCCCGRYIIIGAILYNSFFCLHCMAKGKYTLAMEVARG